MADDDNKRKFTPRFLQSLKPPAKDRKFYWDTGMKSFCCVVHSSGAITFGVKRRIGSTGNAVFRETDKSRCGAQYTEGFITELHEKGRQYEALMRKGVDPREQEKTEAAKAEQARTERQGSLVENVIEDHVREHLLFEEKGKPRLKTGFEGARVLRRDVAPKWKGRTITEISSKDIKDLLNGFKKDGKLAAGRQTGAHLSKLFNWAVGTERYGLTGSPFKPGTVKEVFGKKKPRKRVLNNGELQEFWQGGAAMETPARQFVRFLLVTGQRLRQVSKMKWGDVDIEERLWTIQFERMKNDIAQEVPLSPLAIDLLQSLDGFEKRKPGKFVFTTTKGEKAFQGFSKIKKNLDERIQAARMKKDGPGAEAIDHWIFHDLRRTCRTRLSGLKVPDLISELIIAHSQDELHEIYDQHAYRDEKREALDSWATALLSIVEPKPEPPAEPKPLPPPAADSSSNVVVFPGAARA